MDTDVLIVGGGVGGVAAALAVARAGHTCILTEETDWIGGQLTSQAVPPDENPWIESFGGTGSYRRFRDGVRAYYRDWFPLTASARNNPLLNPGHGTVSRLCHEPRVALAVLEAMLAPFVSAGTVTILRHSCPMDVHTDGDQVQAVTVCDLERGDVRHLTARYVLDATETGELLPLGGVEYVTGSEAQSETGEPHASPIVRPDNWQGVTHCFAMSHFPGDDWTIDRPASYDFWRDYRPDFWPGPLLGWTDLHPTTLEPRTFSLFGPGDDSDEFTQGGDWNWGRQGLWHYRRIRSRQLMEGSTGSDVSLVNWPMNDYWLLPVIDVPHDAKTRAQEGARQLSLSLLYWLQTEAPRPDGGTGYPGLRLRPDITGTHDGLAKSVYIRESRRIRAEFTVCEQHISSTLREKAEDFADSVGIGCYRIDLHPSTGGDNYVDIGCHPFQIPMGALIPVRVDNLLPACKNLGVTHITNGCYRLHPVEWAIGEAAGALAAFCLDRDTLPRAVRANTELLSEFQDRLAAQGVPIRWPSVHAV